MERHEVVIEGNDVAVGYRGRHGRTVHEHLDFCLYRGELTCLLGTNGAGKSTLLRTLAGTQPCLGGQLELFGRPLEDYSADERSRLIGVVLTDSTQVGGLTVYELVALGRQPHTGFFGRLNRYDREQVAHALQAVRIAHKAESYMGQLSDGERQKAMIAKALVQECPLILLDEPTAFLDIASRIDVMALLRRLAVEEGKAVLLSTHDVEQALVLADRLWLLGDKRGLECGVTEDLILSDKIDMLFGSRSHVRFDRKHGVFSPEMEVKGYVYLSAADEILYHWAQNALNRHGYFCVEQKPDGDCPCFQLEVAASRQLVVRMVHSTVECTSFEELLAILDK